MSTSPEERRQPRTTAFLVLLHVSCCAGVRPLPPLARRRAIAASCTGGRFLRNAAGAMPRCHQAAFRPRSPVPLPMPHDRECPDYPFLLARDGASRHRVSIGRHKTHLF